MACVRTRGNQLALVKGARCAGDGAVEQTVLFTLYSKAEAREAIGEGSKGGAFSFEHLVE